MNARDYEAVRAGLTDDWTYFTSAGMKRDFESWKALVSRYTELHIEMIDVRSRLSADGTLAWSTFNGRIRGEVDGSLDDRTLLYTAIFVKTGDGWKLRHLHATAARDSASAPTLVPIRGDTGESAVSTIAPRSTVTARCTWPTPSVHRE